MIIDGKKIRDRIKEELRKESKKLSHPLSIAIVIVGENPVIEGFVRVKEQFATDIGVGVVEKRFSSDVKPDDFERALRELAARSDVQGIIVQLPLPSHFDTNKVLSLIPKEKDVDVLSADAVEAFEQGDAVALPPVAGAVVEICREGSVEFKGKRVLVIGQGRLVGAPVAILMRRKGAEIRTVDKNSPDFSDLLLTADIVVSGAGVAGLIKPDMLKNGVVLIDGGTSESGGFVVGDADPRCVEKASLFTPVPGGVGPVTVAVLFRNLFRLAEKA